MIAVLARPALTPLCMWAGLALASPPLLTTSHAQQPRRASTCSQHPRCTISPHLLAPMPFSHLLQPRRISLRACPSLTFSIVLAAPEVATLYFNASYQLPTPTADNFADNLFTFQKSVLKLQLQLERCITDLAARTERPTIVVFDRGLLDCKACASPRSSRHLPISSHASHICDSALPECRRT